MAVYMIFDVAVKDPSGYDRYKTAVPALIQKHGGEYLIRGGKCEVIEGDWQPSRLVLLRFPDEESVRAFLSDPEYEPLKALRQRAAETNAVVLEGT